MIAPISANPARTPVTARNYSPVTEHPSVSHPAATLADMGDTATLTYLASSTLTSESLGLQTAGGPAAHPRFYDGFLTSPAVAASGLLAVADVARARYFQRGTPIALRDPVVTAGEDRLRFESFSTCGGVHARLDVLPAGLDGSILAHGTTNVDVGNDLRLALARVSSRDPLAMHVGPEELGVRTLDGAVVEKKVPLPTRWLRGFAESAVITRSFAPRIDVDVRSAREFLDRLRASDTSITWVVPSGRGLRVTSRPVPGAVCLAGGGRLQALRGFLRHATRLVAYGPDVAAGELPRASAWELTGPGVRLVLTLSPEPSRGFSGEGAVLTSLVGEDVIDDADLVATMLAWEPRIDVEALARRTDLPTERVQAALVQLGTSGRVGVDLAEGGYFHRSLPYDVAAAAALNPRLVAAERLVAEGAVVPDGGAWLVRSGEETYRVTERDGAPSTCTCPWWEGYRGGRGPCKHVLAVHIATRRTP